MKKSKLIIAFLTVFFILNCVILSVAQDSSTNDTKAPAATAGGAATAAPAPAEAPPPIFSVSQTIEFGGRVTNFSNAPVWDTFVNLHTGPRLIGQTLDVTSAPGTGQLFDNLSISSFGFGGDPNNVARIRIGKDKWYKITGSFRQDRNFFDYNLLANPLNPVGSKPTVIINDSPHEFETVRRISDIGLTILPQHWISARFGFNSVRNEGPSFSTVHQGTEALLAQGFSNVTHTYRAGIDFRLPRKTILSYDQIFTLNKTDTSSSLNGTPSLLANGVPVDLGLPFNTAAGQPCAAPVLPSGFVNPACNAYIGYNRLGRTRTFFPTEQLSLTSSSFKRVDFSSNFIYSGAESDVPNTLEQFLGLSTRTRVRSDLVTGPAYTKRVSVTADAGVTVHLTERMRLTNQFRWSDFRIPGSYNSTDASLVAATLLATPNTYDPATCPKVNSPGCPQHSASSPADIILTSYGRYLGQDAKSDTTELEYDFSRAFGAHVGYRIRNRFIQLRDVTSLDQTFYPSLPNRGACVGQPLVNGVCHVATSTTGEDTSEINEHSAIFGFWTHPTDNFRLTFDMELMSADNSFTRISPRKRQDYWIRGSYSPAKWATLSSSVNLIEKSNDQPDINNAQHLRTYNTNLMLAKSDRWGLDLAYTFQDVFSRSDICFVGSPVVPTTSCGTPFLRTPSFYNLNDNFGSATIMWKPVPKLSTNLGYTITSTNGNTTNLDPVNPPGPLQINYHLPEGSMEYAFSHNWTGHFGWNHYGYNEKSDPGVIRPRDMRGNVFTMSVRFSTGVR